MKIAIIGAGEIGTALHHILPKEGNEINLYDKQPGKVPGQKPLADVVAAADVLVFAVPSWVLRSAGAEIKPLLSKRTVVAFLSKGLEEGSGKTAFEVLSEELSGNSIALISGPMLGEELMADRGGAAVVAGSEPEAAEILQPLLEASGLVVSLAADIRGVSLAGVLKNVYAIGIGMAHALGWDQSMTGWLFDQAFEEMKLVIGRLGGKPETADTAAGLGDLIATGSSDYSNNRQYGIELVGHGSSLIRCEGGVSLPSLYLLLGSDTGGLPFLEAIRSVVIDHASPSDIFSKLKGN